MKERKNDRNNSNRKCCFSLSNVFPEIPVPLVYLNPLQLLSAVCEELIQDKSDLAAVQGPTCITQLPAFSFREEGCFCSQVILIVLGKGVSGLSLCVLAQRCETERGNLEKLLHKAVVVPTLGKMFGHQPFCFFIRQPDAMYKNQGEYFHLLFPKEQYFGGFILCKVSAYCFSPCKVTKTWVYLRFYSLQLFSVSFSRTNQHSPLRSWREIVSHL